MRDDGLPTIGLAIIAKDEEEQLPRLLDSIGFTTGDSENWSKAGPGDGGDGALRSNAAVDFVVVCDTGSTDKTKAVAIERGCRVVNFDWCDDFSAARKASYEAIPDEMDFTLWADCDDVLVDAHLLRQIAAQLPPEVAGTIHRYNYAQDPSGNCVCELWRERLIRKNVPSSWELPIHEVQQVQGQLIHTQQVEWVHQVPPERERDEKRNYNILLADKKRSIKAGELVNPRTLAYLGTEALALGRLDEAVEQFTEYLDRDDARWDEERCQVGHKLSMTYRAKEEWENAAKAAYVAINERPDWADGYLDLAELAINRNELPQALRFLDTIDRLDPPQTLLIINPMDYTYQPLVMKSVVLAKMGRVKEAWEATNQAMQITPDRPDLQSQMGSLHTQRMSDEAEEQFHALREYLVRHDENAKAEQLMACAPYTIWNRPKVSQARIDQREMTLHAIDPETYSRYYQGNPNEAPFEATGATVEEAHERFFRVGYLRKGLEEQQEEKGGPLRVLDLSCNDGWMLLNLADMGRFKRLDGMELNTDASQRAQERLSGLPSTIVDADLHTAAEHFEAGSYDAVVCFETIEHVPDVSKTLAVMAQMTAKNGRCYVSTPNGAFERGNIPEWAKVESKGHLRAMRPHDVAAAICEHGVVEGFEMGQQNLITARFRPRTPAGKVIFYAGGVTALPEKIMDEGLGGSETALCKMAEHFSRLGYDVRVYAGEGGGLRGNYVTTGEDELTGNVLYAPAGEWDPGEECDLFISSRCPEVFSLSISAPKRMLWLHDAEYGAQITPERIARVTDVAMMSEFQTKLLLDQYPFIAGKEFITTNGIETSWFEGKLPAKKPWVVFSSSPDRGLDVLLELWPQIRKKALAAGVKKPQLHHTYAPVYAQYRDAYPHLQQFHAGLEKLNKQTGVVAHDHMGQKELADLYKKAKVWAYPSWTGWIGKPFPEISCISAMEAQAAGCACVYSDYGALKETVQAGVAIPFENDQITDGWKQSFIDSVVLALTAAEVDEDAREWALRQDWEVVAMDWVETLLLTKEKVHA